MIEIVPISAFRQNFQEGKVYIENRVEWRKGVSPCALPEIKYGVPGIP
jgi:hypothetical protein